LSANFAPIDVRKMSTSPDLSATEIRLQDHEPNTELLKRREQIAGMLVAERERQATADSFIVRGEIARHIRALEQRLASIDSELRESVRSDPSSHQTPRLSRVGPAVLFFVLAAAILVLPFWIVAFPPLLDYPNHLARVFILAHLRDPAFHFSEYYASDWGPYPYLTMDVLMVILQKFCNVFTAGKILLSLSVAGVPFASWFFVRQANPKNVLLAGLSLITTWNLFFLWGFINMQLSMALVLLVVGLWLRYLRRPSWPQWIVFLLIVIALYFTHLLGFGIAGLAVAGYCLLTRKAFRQLVLGCIPFALGALTHVITRIAIAGATSRQPNDPWEVIWRPFSEKTEVLGSFMQGYSPRMDQITVIVLVVAGLAAWWRNREFHWNRPWALFIAGLFVLYWIFPAGYGVGADADLRLLPFILLFVPLVASFGKRTRWLFVVLLLLFVARSAIITKTFLAKQAELAGLARSFPVTPANVRVHEFGAPTLIIAMPQLADPNFHRTVVLLIEKNDEGAFGVVDDFARFASFGFQRAVDDEVPGANELSQHGAFPHDVRVGSNIGGGGGVARQRSQVGQAAHLIEQALALQVSGQCDGVTGLVALDQTGNGLENQLVIIAVEVLREDAVRDLVPSRGIQHQSAEYGLLGFHRMRRQPQAVARGSARPKGTIADATGHALPTRLPAATLRRRW